jgi:hypothetical protein
MKTTKSTVIAVATLIASTLFSACGPTASAPHNFTDEVLPVSITFPSYPHHSQTQQEPVYRRMLQCHSDSVGYWLKIERTNIAYNDAEILAAKADFEKVVQQQGFIISRLLDSTYMGLPAIYAHSMKNEEEVYMLMCFKDNIRVEASAMITDDGKSKTLVDDYFQTLRIE